MGALSVGGPISDSAALNLNPRARCVKPTLSVAALDRTRVQYYVAGAPRWLGTVPSHLHLHPPPPSPRVKKSATRSSRAGGCQWW